MINSVLEIALMRSLPVDPDKNVIFDVPLLEPTGITYNTTTGIITFKETGQYSIKWWLATETTLKGSIAFELQTEQGSLTPGCSPIKNGQVCGFNVIDIQKVETTMILVNKSITNTMLSRKTAMKGHLLITPIAPSSLRVYRGNLSARDSTIEVPLGNGLYYRLEYNNLAQFRLGLRPMNGTTFYDYRRLSAFDGGSACEGDYSDNEQLTALTIKDPTVYFNSREMHWVMIRVQNPASQLWSTYEVRLFASNGRERVTIWVNVIEEEVSY